MSSSVKQPPPPPPMPRTPLTGSLPKTTSAISHAARSGFGDGISLRDKVLMYLIESTFGVNEYLCDNEEVPAAIAGRFEDFPHLNHVWRELRQDAQRSPFPLAPSPAAQKNIAINADAFIDAFADKAPERYEPDTFRYHENVPQFIMDEFHFIDKEAILTKAWEKARTALGHSGDCRHEWERFLEWTFVEQMQAANDMDSAAWPEDNAKAQEARARLDMMTPAGIHAMAAALKGRDTASILTWGEDFNRQRAQAFKQSHDRDIRDINDKNDYIHTILKDFETLLRTRAPSKLRSFFARLMHDPLENTLEERIRDQAGLPPAVDQREYRFYTPAQKMARGAVIIDQIESYYTTAAPEQLNRFLVSEQSENRARDFADLTSLYVSALKKNRTRLISEGAQAETVDTRIAELERAREACTRDVAHFTASAALHMEMRTRMHEIADISVPAYRAQMQTAYLQALGKQALSADFTAKALGDGAIDKARAKEFADNLEALADRVRDLSTLQNAMANNEKLVLEHKQPLALEYKAVLALPAPSSPDDDLIPQ